MKKIAGKSVMNQSQGKQLVEKLVNDFSDNQEYFLSEQFNETEVRNRFIDPFFKALGWEFEQNDISPEFWDVHREYSQKEGSVNKKPDYAFRIDGKLKFFTEAKAPHVRLEDKNPAHQAKRYAFSTSGKAPVVILTNFYKLKVFNALERPVHNNPLQGLLGGFDLTYQQYPKKWDLLYSHFSKEAVSAGSLDILAGKISKNTRKMDDEFLADISRWREQMAVKLANLNQKMNEDELNEAVQRILDRMIFLRNLEDRDLETENTLLKIAQSDAPAYPQLVKIFNGLNEFYNGLLFKPHFSENIRVDDKLLKTVIRQMCYPESPFRFDVIEPEILGHIYERFLGSEIRLVAKRKAVVEEKPEVRKAGGVYYTPQYIVDYIVKNTVGEKIEGMTPEEIRTVRILDPACGSGSFLLGAFDYLIRYHQEWYAKLKKRNPYQHDFYLMPDGKMNLTPAKKADILKKNIFGVDIDREATEVAMISLYLKLMDNSVSKNQMELMHGYVLPDMTCNIKCGNSLIAPDFYTDGLFLTPKEERKINVFDWKMAFPEVFKQDGFDCVIGNPPYVKIQNLTENQPKGTLEYFKKNYISAQSGNFDIYVMFIEKSYKLLNKNGLSGYIQPHKFFQAEFGENIRNFLAEYKAIQKIVHFGAEQVFESATTYTCLLFLAKKQTETFEFIKVNKPTEWSIDKNKATIFTSKQPQPTEKWNFASDEKQNVLDKIRQQSQTLGDITRKIFVGLQTSADKIYILKILKEKSDTWLCFSNSLQKEIEIEKGLVKLFLMGKDVKRYEMPIAKNIVIFPYLIENGKAVLMEQDYIQKNFSKGWQYLLDNKRDLKNREKGKFKNNWYQFGRNQNINEFEVRKIFTPDIANQCQFSIDIEKKFYAQSTVFSLSLNDKAIYSDLFYLGVLNSKIMRFHIGLVGTTLRGGYTRFHKKYIENFPTPNLDLQNKTEKQQHDQLVKLVETMLELNKRKQEANQQTEKDSLQHRIDYTDKEIDTLVYKLYDLTPEEIEVVEGKA